VFERKRPMRPATVTTFAALACCTATQSVDGPAVRGFMLLRSRRFVQPNQRAKTCPTDQSVPKRYLPHSKETSPLCVDRSWWQHTAVLHESVARQSARPLCTLISGWWRRVRLNLWCGAKGGVLVGPT
jgi:hypothetical protein